MIAVDTNILVRAILGKALGARKLLTFDRKLAKAPGAERLF